MYKFNSLLFVSFLLSSTCLFSQKRFSMGIRSGLIVPFSSFDERFPNPDIMYKIENNSGFFAAIETGYELSPKISIGAGFEYQSFNVELLVPWVVNIIQNPYTVYERNEFRYQNVGATFFFEYSIIEKLKARFQLYRFINLSQHRSFQIMSINPIVYSESQYPNKQNLQTHFSMSYILFENKNILLSPTVGYSYFIQQTAETLRKNRIRPNYLFIGANLIFN
jgi:hypothetical protein